MLNLFGGKRRLCDGINRRDFLSIGSLGLAGLSLPELLRAEDAAGIGESHKSVIMIYLTGGPPHQDMVDLKPNAPSEIRGEFSPISTSLSGVQISELMPMTAKMMDKFSIIRSLVGSEGRHSSFQCATGHSFANQPQGGWPELGCVLSKKYGAVDPAIPPAIDLSIKMEHLPYNLPGPGFLGHRHAPFKPTGPSLADLVLSDVKLRRFDDRKTLLTNLDAVKRKIDSDGYPAEADAFTQRALDVLTSSKLANALDLEQEDPKLRERYGKDDKSILPYSSKGYQALVSKFLIARRLVEAGARCVTVSYADFDWHGSNFAHGRKVIPVLDQALTALVEDLHDRGMDEDVTVVVWGEFGRTPKINTSAGRDHWTQVAFAMLAGGGMNNGQVIGATNKYAEEAIDRPVKFQEVFATLYKNLGIDPSRNTIDDLTGRPRYLMDEFNPIPELA
ncbi:MAG TPA: DUF1501 domain-containing protein [Planctomycetaceae bacterium]|nr:DUF1501 domain-containing protein [Planctomycetaceae bacterium]HCK70978.1 DUF1501 domain-containing protein [Planctomycetaceae bacterium]HCP84997.1 DUF1501 domain-containing protein [Planctomycetaceae bacterium]|tara:strand:+ start:1153 stop:2493 length:1341 start_codon:yes stop_codon:yes gene_type:complete